MKQSVINLKTSEAIQNIGARVSILLQKQGLEIDAAAVEMLSKKRFRDPRATTFYRLQAVDQLLSQLVPDSELPSTEAQPVVEEPAAVEEPVAEKIEKPKRAKKQEASTEE